MKKLFPFLFAILLTGPLALAQTTETKEKTRGTLPESQRINNPAMKDGLMMQGGKVLLVNNGVAAQITADQTLSNGMVVMQNGTVKMTDGSTVNLHDGDHMTMEGKIMHRHPAMQAATDANKSRSKTAYGKTKIKADPETGNMQNGKPAKSKLKSTDEKMKLKNNQGESKTKYEE